MKATLKVLTLLFMALMPHASSVTVGSMHNGNCYPFMGNDSGTSVGVSIDWHAGDVRLRDHRSC
jgi:hypothetical protein